MEGLIILFIVGAVINAFRQKKAKQQQAVEEANKRKQALFEAERRAQSESAAEQRKTVKAEPIVPRTVAIEGTSIEHVVAPITESTHGHTETSMTGFVECDTDIVQRKEVKYPTHIADTFAELKTDRTSLIKGILYSEILDKPRALRRRA